MEKHIPFFLNLFLVFFPALSTHIVLAVLLFCPLENR